MCGAMISSRPDRPDCTGGRPLETIWHYMQGGPGVFMRDLHFYTADGDACAGRVSEIDTVSCLLYLLTGE